MIFFYLFKCVLRRTQEQFTSTTVASIKIEENRPVEKPTASRNRSQLKRQTFGCLFSLIHEVNVYWDIYRYGRLCLATLSLVVD